MKIEQIYEHESVFPLSLVVQVFTVFWDLVETSLFFSGQEVTFQKKERKNPWGDTISLETTGKYIQSSLRNSAQKKWKKEREKKRRLQALLGLPYEMEDLKK